MINEAAARAWPERNPIGAAVRLSTPANDLEVVGVVGDVRNSGLNKPAAPEIYMPPACGGEPEVSSSARACRPIN